MLLVIVWVCSILLFVIGRDDYYRKDALTFLREYGDYYNLIDPFIKNISDSYSLLAYHGRKKEPIIERYKIRNYSTFLLWDTTVDQTNAWNISYDQNKRDNDFNNRYRYGLNSADRFLHICFHRDPWTDSSATVNFISFGTGLERQRLECHFTEPLVASSPVKIEYGFSDQIGHKIPFDNIVSCPVPSQILAILQPHIASVTLNLVRIINESDKVTLLHNIEVYRVHELDRRAFNISGSFINNGLNDPMVIEWLVYHILLGVEHFYIFDQRKLSTDLNYWNGAIRPFLDANIVTVIPYHYYWESTHIQKATFNIFLQKFGHLNHIVGFQDVDEFFLPTGCLNFSALHSPLTTYPDQLILQHLECLGFEWDQIPVVMYNTLEMGCRDNPTNLFLSTTANRETVTTHCTVSGYLFDEMKVGHGKMFVKPHRVKYIPTPHRYDNYDTYHAESNVGLFRHFNGFRYSNDFRGGWTRKVDMSLNRFTLRLLEEHGFIVKEVIR